MEKKTVMRSNQTLTEVIQLLGDLDKGIIIPEVWPENQQEVFYPYHVDGYDVSAFWHGGFADVRYFIIVRLTR